MRQDAGTNRLRMKLPRKVSALLFALCAMLVASGCTSLKDRLEAPSLELIAIQPQSLRGGNTLIALTRLRITNPNSIALPIRGGEVNMNLAGKPVAVGDLADSFTIPANGSEEIDIRISLDLASSMTLGMNMLAGDTQLPYSLRGFVDVGIAYLGRINFVDSGEVSLNQLRSDSVE